MLLKSNASTAPSEDRPNSARRRSSRCLRRRSRSRRCSQSTAFVPYVWMPTSAPFEASVVRLGVAVVLDLVAEPRDHCCNVLVAVAVPERLTVQLQGPLD